MNIKKFIICSFIALFLSSSIFPSQAIFLDIETLFETNKMKASSYIGKINSLKYAGKIGHVPSKDDLFKALTPMKSSTTLQTYNTDLKMPLILSDWLLGNKSASSLLTDIKKYITTSSMFDIQKTVFTNIVDMMLTPDKLADTQSTISETIKIIDELKKKNINVYLVGNWANVTALKSKFSSLFTKFKAVLISDELHELKPYKDFYDKALMKSGLSYNQAIWIEKEQKFIDSAKSYGFNVAIFNPNKPKALYDELKKFGINLK